MLQQKVLGKGRVSSIPLGSTDALGIYICGFGNLYILLPSLWKRDAADWVLFR